MCSLAIECVIVTCTSLTHTIASLSRARAHCYFEVLIFPLNPSVWKLAERISGFVNGMISKEEFAQIHPELLVGATTSWLHTSVLLSTNIYVHMCIYIYVYSGTCWQRKLYMERFLSMYSSCVISQYNIIRIRSRRTFSHQIPFSFFILFLLITPNNSKCALPIEMIIEVPLLSHQCVRVRSLFIISKLGNKSQEKLS